YGCIVGGTSATSSASTSAACSSTAASCDVNSSSSSAVSSSRASRATCATSSREIDAMGLRRYAPREVDHRRFDDVLLVVEGGDVVAALEQDALDGPRHLLGQHVAVLGRNDVVLLARDDERRARDLAEVGQRLLLGLEQR